MSPWEALVWIFAMFFSTLIALAFINKDRKIKKDQ